MVNESTPFGRQAARKRCFAAATGAKGLRCLPALGLLSLAIALAQAAPVHAQSIGETRDYAISSQPLGAALNQLALAADRQIMVPPELVRGRTAPALAGHYSLDAALRQLLAGSGLTYEITDTGTVMVRQTPLDAPHRSVKPASATSQKASQEREPTTLQSVQVTGTRIRGGTTPSPVITIGSEQIQHEGFTDLGEVIRSVPQNFTGGQNPGITGAGGNIGNQDFTGGSALNLRGLGADASLTLLNGRRLVYDGFTQAVDISAIPVDAVERLEIVPDGASAIYGSDAVGGVANVILKRDFDGVTLGARYGGATEGGLATREYTATAGTTWASGGLIATFKDADVDPIYTRQRIYTKYLIDPYTIYNGSDSRSGLVSVHQSMGDVAELRLDALRTERDMARYQGLTVDSYYHYSPETSIESVSPTIEFFLRNNWSIALGGTYGKDENIDERHLVSAAGSHLTLQDYYGNKSRSWEIGAEGPLFSLGKEDARLAIGIGSRKNEFKFVGNVSPSSYGGDERARFAYAELGVPFVSLASDIFGVHRLEFSAALRGEDYDSFGRVATPKFGVIYDPTADVTFKASWGKSFKAPTLLQRYQSKHTYLFSTPMVGSSGSPVDATALMSYGGNADLRPERARTWTASLALHPEALPGLDAELTWFDIDYADRVVQPVNYHLALSDPAYAAFVDRSPTPEKIQDLFGVYDDEFNNLSGMAYDPSKVVALIHDQYVNAARQRIKGLDLSGSYRFDLDGGKLTLRESVSWLDSAQTTSPGQPDQTLAGTVFNPARLNGRAGVVWASGRFSASSFVNYTGGVINRLVTTVPEKTASFTTVDATINYSLDERAGAFSRMTFEFSVQNLLNRAPPLYTAAAATYVPYDATNYSAIGRFVSVSVSKHW